MRLMESDILWLIDVRGKIVELISEMSKIKFRWRRTQHFCLRDT